MSKVPAILRSKLMQLAIGFAAGTSAYMSVQAPSHEVQLAMELGAHYESSGRHIGVPYVDKLGKGQPLTVCNGVTGPGVQLGKYYTKDDCQRLELPKYLDAEKAAKRIFRHWSQYNVWVRASFIDMIYNLGESAVAASSMVRLANAGDLPAACAQMPRWVRGTVNGQSVPLPGLIDRRTTTQELCRDWGRDGHFTAALLSQGERNAR